MKKAAALGTFLLEVLVKLGVQNPLRKRANRRNGHSKKTVLTGTSKMQLAIPRDRLERSPKLIARYQRRFPDFDAKIVSMYARGMSVREIRGHRRNSTASTSRQT